MKSKTEWPAIRISIFDADDKGRSTVQIETRQSRSQNGATYAVAHTNVQAPKGPRGGKR